MGLILLIILLIAAAVVLLYLWAIRPDTRRKQHCLSFARWDFAHRGLWNMDRGIPENSLPAFWQAVRHGFAIEDLSAQVPNAFLARTGSGAPTVAILAEFDALPGSSQLAGVAEPQQNADETIKGFHGCGHHLFATA